MSGRAVDIQSLACHDMYQSERAGSQTGNMTAPFFIVGSGRSGSTLLRVILCAHSRITIPPETYFIKPLLERLPANGTLDPVQLAEAVDIITGHYRWPDMGLAKAEFEHAVAELGQPTLRDVMDIIYRHHLDREGKTVWGDKTPPYVAIIPGLVRLYPEARIIHLVRDGRDVAKSFQKVGWYGPWLHDNTREWRNAIRAVKACRVRHPEIPIHELRYEQLVLDTEYTIRLICRFLGVDFEPAMLSWADSLAGRIPEREAHIHRKLQRRPRPTDIDRWRREMSDRELLVAEAFMARELRTSGYSLRYSNPLWRPVFILTRGYCRLVLPLYTLVTRVPAYIGRRIARILS
jgi:hypothetical protein